MTLCPTPRSELLNLSDIGREILYPVVDTNVLFANITFSLVATLVIAAVGMGPFGMFSLPLAIIALPALFRYALYLLEARAQGKPSPGLGIELFNWAENFWSLFPLVMLAGLSWLGLYLYANFSLAVAISGVILLSAFYPASIAVLGVTRSPFGSLNPVNIVNMIKLCGPDYLWIPLLLASAILAVFWLFATGIWLVGLCIAVIYIFFLLFSLTGAVLAAHDAMDEVDIDTPLDVDKEQTAAVLLKQRQKVTTHAYGLASRGNRDGGLAHIRQWIATETDRDTASQWFFLEMLKWENTDSALEFGQDYFAHLLSENRDAQALKLISRCHHEDSRWKPHPRDQDAANELATKYQRDDLIRLLKS